MFRTLLIATLSAAAAQTTFAACSLNVNNDIQPIFNANCVVCHQDASPAGGMSLQRASMLKNTINVPATEVPKMMRIKPGDADASYLYRKLANTHVEAGGSGASMPMGSQLPKESIELVRTWIAECAQ